MIRQLQLLILLTLFGSVKASIGDDVNAWVGEGANTAILVIDFADGANSSYKWGYRFEADSVSGQEILDSIMAKDPKLSGNVESFMTDVTYKDHEGLTPSDYSFYWLTYTLDNGVSVWEGNNGNSTKIGNGQSFGAVFSSSFPGNPPADPISADILPGVRKFVGEESVSQWIGKGDNQTALIVDFNDGEERIAWGIRFDADSITGQEILDAVANADTNFKGSFDGFVTDIIYKDREGVTPIDYTYYWLSYTSNNSYTWVGNNGNVTKLGNQQWFGVTFTNLFPAPGPDTAYTAIINSTGTEDIIVGEKEVIPSVEGIPLDDARIQLWANKVTVERGYLNIQDTTIEVGGSNRASFGEPSNAEGPSTGETGNVVSLGDGGFATAEFDKDYVIHDGVGADFVVFENAFSPTTLELGFVEVSSNGTDYVRFPSNSLTDPTIQTATFGASDPALIFGLAGIHPAGVGTPFDLDAIKDSSNINIDAITHIRIVDVVGTIDGVGVNYDSEGNVINDPFPSAFESGGFDLEAVGAINIQQALGFSENQVNLVSVYPNPCSSSFSINIEENIIKVEVMDMMGKSVGEIQLESGKYNAPNQLKGNYLLLIQSKTKTYHLKVLFN